jgi:hypothetical protein
MAWSKCKAPFKKYKGRKVEIKGRVYVHMIHRESRKHRITSLARYRMSVYLGRRLLPSEQVDHKDEDRTNDSLRNLQLLPGGENTKKSVRHRKGLIIAERVQTCTVCGAYFLHHKVNQTCSAECKKSILADGRSVGNKIAPSVINKIKKLRKKGHSSYAIVETLSISRNTVMKYWA